MALNNKKQRRPALLFDLDGVLWSSVDAHRRAFERALKDQGSREAFSKDAYRRLAGMTTERAFAQFLKEKNKPSSPALIAAFSKRKRFWARRYLPRYVRLDSRLYATLRTLRAIYRLALVSSSHPATVALFLKRSKSRRFFDVILSSREVSVSKPSPLIYRTALRRLGVKPAEAIAVEDTVSGIQAARGAGIAVIGMRGTCSPASLRRAGAFRNISRLSELNRHPRGSKRGPSGVKALDSRLRGNDEHL